VRVHRKKATTKSYLEAIVEGEEMDFSTRGWTKKVDALLYLKSRAINILINNSEFLSNQRGASRCQRGEMPSRKNTTYLKAFFSAILALFVFLHVNGTLFRVIPNKIDQSRLLNFSCLTNCMKLLDTSPQKSGQVTCLNGLRFWSMVHGYLRPKDRPVQGSFSDRERRLLLLPQAGLRNGPELAHIRLLSRPRRYKFT